MAEQPQGNDRLRGAALDRHERDERDGREHDGHDGAGRRKTVYPADADAIEERADAAREEDQPAVVDDRPPCRARFAAQRGCDQRHGDGAERQVDVEDPAPRHEVGEEATEERAHQRGESPHPGNVTLHLGATLEAEEIRNDRHANRHQRARTETLQHAERDELDHAPRQTGQRGADEKDHETGEERGPTSEQIGQASPERHRDGGRQEEPGEDPRVDLEAAQALHDDRHGGGDHGRFHGGEKDRHHDPERQAGLRRAGAQVASNAATRWLGSRGCTGCGCGHAPCG